MNQKNCLHLNETALTKSELRILEHMVILRSKLEYVICEEGQKPEEMQADFQIKTAIIQGKIKNMRKHAKY